MYGESNQTGSINISSGTYDRPKAECVDVPRVSQQMGTIQKLIAENRELASMLEQRLNAVLRPAGPEVAGNAQKDPRQPASPLTNDLEEFAAQLSRLSSQYNDMLNRLEI